MRSQCDKLVCAKTDYLMESNNSYSLYREVVSALYCDIAECYNVTLQVQRTELRVIEARFSKEGISFLTKGLPRFGKAVDSALSSGTYLSVVGFAADNGSKVPKFLGWLLRLVFDASGKELDCSNPLALAHFRQLVYLVYKLEIPYDEETESSVLDSFCLTDSQLPLEDASPIISMDDTYSFETCDVSSTEWLNDARDLITRVVSPLDPTGADIRPQHGPGVVSTGENVCQKTLFSRIYSHLERIYPFTEWNMFNLQHVVSDIPAKNPRIKFVTEATAKVILVPKDSRGPRLISCEPLEVQWIQQGLGRALMRTIESSKWSRGYVNFTDQSINRNLALSSSLTKEWVTLDMKDASDRVSLALVKYLFQGHPKLLEALLATRSRSTLLPNGTVVALKKYAPMGSALCFPVESLIFWALAVSAIKQNGKKSARESRRSCFVYGDDLIVKETDYRSLLHLFPLVGLKFNEQKCCVADSFRESCGCDAYKGVDVTPVKLKTTWDPDCYDPKCLTSYTAFSNAMYVRGHFRTSELVRQMLVAVYGELPYTNRIVPDDKPTNLLEEFVPGFIPEARYQSRTVGLAFICYEPAILRNKELKIRTRFDRDLQIQLYRTWTSLPKKRKTVYDGYAEWLRRLSFGYGYKHGGVYALVRRNRLKRAWIEI